jgi:hypothetical protein
MLGYLISIGVDYMEKKKTGTETAKVNEPETY